MNEQIQVDRLRKVRAFLLDLIKDLSIEQLNRIPGGFANNILWHLGHLVAAQQGICYLRSGLEPVVEERYIHLYKPGTKPEQFIDGEETDALRENLFTSLDQLETDLQNNHFANYVPWTTRYGVPINSIDDALQFLLFHEGLHSGYVSYMKRLV